MLRVFRYDHKFEFPKLSRSNLIEYRNIDKYGDVDRILKKDYKNKDNYIDSLD